MKNLTSYNSNCFDIHQKAVNAKQKSLVKSQLLKINPIVEHQYQIYENSFQQNSINSITCDPNLSETQLKKNLINLYSYQSKTIRGVREKIRLLQQSTIQHTCQNCTIDSVGTMDHILPKTAFPEFSVNPLNLFPCCSKCNTYKLDSVSSSTNQKFLNLYIDTLPKTQYLFLNIFIDNFQQLDFKFFLNNPNSEIDFEYFQIIQRHYNNLHLLERMKFKAIEHISELKNSIISFSKILPFDKTVESLIDIANSNKEAYGYNHWKNILEISLLQSSIFLNEIKKTNKTSR